MITEQIPFPCFDMVNRVSQYANKFLPARSSFGSVSPVMKIYGKETGLNPVYSMPLKLVAASLSEIEMDLDCYNVSNLQISTLALKDLFFEMGMPAIFKLAVQMEGLARENQFQQVKDLLREIKKIIGLVVKHRMQPGD